MFPVNARILFQGDSITDGNRGRNADPNHILGHGYAFIIAAKFGAMFPQYRWEFMNRGISGNTVRDLEGRWQPDTLDLRPDVLSILVGVNDAAQWINGWPGAVGAPEYERTYDRLLARTRESLPGVRLVICEPFILPVGRVGENWPTWQSEMKARQAVAAKLAERYQATYVRFQRAFDEACQKAPADYWIWDGVHPTYRGHQIMAEQWVSAVRG